MAPTTNADLAQALNNMAERLGKIEGRIDTLVDLQARVQALELGCAKTESLPGRVDRLEQWAQSRPANLDTHLEKLDKRIDDLETWTIKADALVSAGWKIIGLLGLNTIILVLKILADLYSTGRP